MKGYTDIRLFYLDLLILFLIFFGLFISLAWGWIILYLILPVVFPSFGFWNILITGLGVVSFYAVFVTLTVPIIKKIKCNIVKSK